MSENLLRAFKWYVLALFVVVGTSAFLIAEEKDTVKPMLIGVLGLGAAYIMSAFWKDFRDKVLLASIVVFFGVAIINPYVLDIIYVLTGRVLEIDKYVLWALMNGIIGIPVMFFVFRRWGD